MKILFIHSDIGMLAGGGENFSRHLIDELLLLQHSVTLICVARNNGTTPLPLPTGVEIKLLSGYWNRQIGQRWLTSIGHYLRSWKSVHEIWPRFQLALAGRAIRWHNRRFRLRMLKELHDKFSVFDMAYVHGDPVLANKLSARIPTCLRLPGLPGPKDLPILRSIQSVCANGDVLCQLRQICGDQKSIQELPIGLDGAHFSFEGKNVREKTGWEPGDFIIGYVGRITVLKGVSLLVKAFSELAGRYPFLRLLLIGEGEEVDTLKEYLRVAGLERRCCWAGRQPYESLGGWYRSIDLFVMPSLYENFSNALLEAMGCGLPVLASNVGGNPLLVEDGRNGWLFDSGSVSHLTGKLNVAIESRLHWHEMGQWSRRKIATGNYSWANTAQTLLRIMEPYLEKSATIL